DRPVEPLGMGEHVVDEGGVRLARDLMRIDPQLLDACGRLREIERTERRVRGWRTEADRRALAIRHAFEDALRPAQEGDAQSEILAGLRKESQLGVARLRARRL